MKNFKSILFVGLIYIIVLLTLLLLILFLRDSGGEVVLILAASALIWVIIGILLFISGVYYPLEGFRNQLKTLSRGEIYDYKTSGYATEIREMENFVQMLVLRLKEMIRVSNQLAEGEEDIIFEMQDEKDELGQALLKVKDSIHIASKESSLRRKQDEQQNWASQGLAKFGTLLRDFEHNESLLSNKFIHELVDYLEMEVGGLFLLKKDGDEPVYELSGAYAFDREKLINKSFKPGEGLVGRCAVEKERIIITDVPENYIRIRSGLGEDNPSSILLIPIVFDDQVLGVIELASFNDVPKYKIDFLESLGSSIATSLLKSVTLK
jgi:methyl-accepting chemotaxis protein